MVATNIELPGLDCGICGYRTCDELRERLASKPDLIRRCIHLSDNSAGGGASTRSAAAAATPVLAVGDVCAASCGAACGGKDAGGKGNSPIAADSVPGRRHEVVGAEIGTVPSRGHRECLPWQDNLGREFDFYLEHFPEEPGPREIIIPHNPSITREMEIQNGDILIGRPLGMSCGCPITHCGVAMDVDMRTGVIVWCVTGPLGPRAQGFKDLGYYIAEGYEGLVHEARCELKVGMRYFFQPRMCMLQWRHSGLVNYLSRMGRSYQVRVEGLWIG